MGNGEDATVVFGDGSTAEHVNVTPNHHALARQFAVSDNAYVDSDVSADGHRWLVGVAPDEFVETSTAASYGGGQDYREDLPAEAAPGRRNFFEANSSVSPEDYPEAGSIWENFDRNGKSFRNYGEGFEFAGSPGPGARADRGAPAAQHPDARPAVRQHRSQLPDLQHQHLRSVPRGRVRA